MCVLSVHIHVRTHSTHTSARTPAPREALRPGPKRKQKDAGVDRDLAKVTQPVRDWGPQPRSCAPHPCPVFLPQGHVRTHGGWGGGVRETGQLRAWGCRAAYGSGTQTSGKVRGESRDPRMCCPKNHRKSLLGAVGRPLSQRSLCSFLPHTVPSSGKARGQSRGLVGQPLL